MTRRLEAGPRTERVYDTQADTPWFLQSPRLRRLTEIWIEERRRQLGIRQPNT